MKKILMLSFIAILALTGCDASVMDTMSCSLENTAGNLTTRMNYNIDYQGNEVKKVRITYDYNQNNTDNTGNGTDNGTNAQSDTDNANTGARNTTGTQNDTDGVGTGTDGTTNDTQIDNDGIIDGVVGNAIDSIVGGVTDVILDVSGLRDRHVTVQNTYGNIAGFSVQNTNDNDNNYKVTYVIDYDTISDDDLRTLNLSRDLDTLRDSYVSQGFTCK